jgi:hypothetical protein
MHALAETAELRTVSRQFAQFALADAIVVTAPLLSAKVCASAVAFHRIAAIGSSIRLDDIAILK